MANIVKKAMISKPQIIVEYTAKIAKVADDKLRRRYLPIFDNKICLLTKHKKQNQILPVLRAHWAGELITWDSFDTDILGSFDGKTARVMSPLQCALKKAHIACELSGLNQGLGSEGSFNGFLGMGNMNEEFIAFVDIRRKIEIVGVARKMVSLQSCVAESPEALDKFISQFAPEQAWILETKCNEFKGLFGIDSVLACVKEDDWPVTISPDFRAMHCPERHITLEYATKDLLKRLSAKCPSCEYPGFVFEKKILGLPCELCGSPTNQAKAYQAECNKCRFSVSKNVEEQQAASFYCPMCNP
ncbi:DUF6671 family protein [Agaribacter flavus]|uniref:DUF6671 family protein n=1 Tax=Agaribacter flavus TaxID=1902781 RepID=A0ABV7FPA7_9ALTE